MNFIIACDLEGIHGVVGEAYKTLGEAFDYEKAVEGAQLEINAAAKALFDIGAERVIVWDNHGGGGNVDFSKLDSKVIRADTKKDVLRGDFAKAYNVDGVVFLGYHAKEGTPNGVLAHTYNSKELQYVKLNGVSIGELYVDSRIFAGMGIKSIFHAGDDVSVGEMKSICPHAVTVITKYGKGRNSAELRGRDEVLRDIYDGVVEAAKRVFEPCDCSFPMNARLEIRYTRAERAAEIYERAKNVGIAASYGEDTHSLRFDVKTPSQIPLLF